jgi:hypothetical protein
VEAEVEVEVEVEAEVEAEVEVEVEAEELFVEGLISENTQVKGSRAEAYSTTM